MPPSASMSATSARYYEGAGHNLLGHPAVKADIMVRLYDFLCRLFACAPAG